MSEYYKAQRTKNIFDPTSQEPFKISRSKIELFTQCPRCFWLDTRQGVARPPGFPFNLNSAVDTLLKKEFDIHRSHGTKHPLMETYKVDAIPFYHKKINEWRTNFVGIQFLHKPTNLKIFGAVDDIWQNPQEELIVVDYKATSKTATVTIDAPWQDSYKRQMEVYQWLLRKNDFAVADTGYFVYCNGKTDRQAFDAKLEFDVRVIPYKGNDRWIEKTLPKIKKTLQLEQPPAAGKSCDYCSYRGAAHTKEYFANPSSANPISKSK